MDQYVNTRDIRSTFERLTDEHAYTEFLSGIYVAKNWIEDIKPADVEQVRHGRWMMSVHFHFPYKPKSDDEQGFHTATCSECHITQSINIYKGTPQFRYCPYCGAKMDGKENEE